MSPCKNDDDVLFPEVLGQESSLATRRDLPMLPRDAYIAGLTNFPSDATIIALAEAVLEARPGLLGQLFPSVARRQALANIEMATAIVEAGRRYLRGIGLLRLDAVHAMTDVAKAIGDLTSYVATKPLRVDIEVEQLRATRDRMREQRREAHAVRRTSNAMLNDAYSASAPEPSATTHTWDSQDPVSVKARTATIMGIAQYESDRIDDPAVAFAAVAYLRKRIENKDDDTARFAAFQDVRTMIATNSLTPESANQSSALLKRLRDDYKKMRDGAAGLGVLTSGLKGRRP